MRTVMLFCLSVLSLASSIPASAELLKSNSISITNLLEKARTASKAEYWPSDSVARDELWVYVDSSSTDKVEQGLDLLPGYQWISIKLADGTIYKVLGPDYIERSKWSSLSDAADEEDRRRIREYIEKRLAEYKSALALSKETLQTLGVEDTGLVRDLTTPFLCIGVELLVGFNNEQMDQVLSPQGLRVNVRDLPTDMQRKLLDCFQKMIDKSAQKHAKQEGKNALGVTELEEEFINTGALQFYGYDGSGFHMIFKSDDPWFGGISLSDRLRDPQLAGCEKCIMGPKYYSYSNYREWLLQAQGMSAEDIVDTRQIEDYVQKLSTNVYTKENESRLTKTPPRFGKRNAPDVNIEKQCFDCNVIDGQSFVMCRDFIQGICEQKGYSFFAFKNYKAKSIKYTDNTNLGYVLDQAVDTIGDYVWAYQNEQIILAPRHFAYKLAENIPLTTINKLRAIAAQTGGVFDLDGLAEVVSLLNWRQLNALPGNVPDDLMDSGIVSAKTRNAPIRLYASLSPRRQKSACNGGVSYTVLGSKQRDLFYEALGSVVTAVDLLPEPSYFSVDDRGPQNGRYHFITFTFGFVDGTAWPIDLRLPVRNNKSEAAQVAPNAADKPEPAQPQVLAVMKSLAEWNYSGRREHDDDNELKAIMSLQEGDKLVKRTLKVGETLEGAKLVEIGAKSAIFSLDGAQITFPITQATALAPFDPKAPSIYTSWIGVDKAWKEALEKELSN